MPQLQAAGMYLILQVILLRRLVILAGLPVELDPKPAILLAGLALVAEQAQQVSRTSLAVSVSAVALCMCTKREDKHKTHCTMHTQVQANTVANSRRVLYLLYLVTASKLLESKELRER
jgi:hypothetical protein